MMSGLAGGVREGATPARGSRAKCRILESSAGGSRAVCPMVTDLSKPCAEGYMPAWMRRTAASLCFGRGAGGERE